MFGSLRDALDEPGTGRTLAALLACHVAAGMVTLSLVLATEDATGRYAAAGAVGGGHAVGLALVAPAWGRAADRRGARPTLAGAAVAQAVAFSAFGAALVGGAPAWALVALGALTGACTPPASAVAKKVFVAGGPGARQRTLLAATGVFAELVFVVGPLLVALIAGLAAPPHAVAATAAASFLGAMWLRASVPHDVAAAPPSDRPRPRPGAWRAARRVVAITVLNAFAIGAVQVSTVAHAGALTLSAGLLVAAIAVGGVASSLTYAARTTPGTLESHLAASLAAYGGVILAMSTTPGVGASLAIAVLIGVAAGPADTIETLLLADRTPPDRHALAFSVLTTANWLGFAVGAAAAGALVDAAAAGPRLGYVAGGIAALAGASLLLGQRRR